jgi:hypothetical protein
MTTEVPNTEPTNETVTVKPANNHVDGGTAALLTADLTATAETGTVDPDNNHVDSEPTG